VTPFPELEEAAEALWRRTRLVEDALRPVIVVQPSPITAVREEGGLRR